MPCEIVESSKGRLTIEISGLLKKSELDRAEKVAIEKMRSGGQIRLLFLTVDFQGWDNSDDWGDVSFQSQYDSQIEKIAIVCEKRWQEKAEAFVGKGIRSVEIRCFAPSQVELARAWIG
jgi:hypothetical protein